MTPEHYQTPVSPWDLQAHMHSSGNAFVDARRCDAIKYIFRNKENLLEDLKKAHHCLAAAITALEPKPKVKTSYRTEPSLSSVFFKDKTLDGTSAFNVAGMPGTDGIIYQTDTNPKLPT